LTVSCYHYETRYRTVTRSRPGPHGGSYTTTEPYQQRIDTFAKSQLLVTTWKDSTPLPFDDLDIDLKRKKFTHVHIKNAYDWETIQDSQKFQELQTTFYEMYRHMDAHADLTINFNLPIPTAFVLKEKDLVIPKYYDKNSFMVFSFLMLSWAHMKYVNSFAETKVIKIKRTFKLHQNYFQQMQQ